MVYHNVINIVADRMKKHPTSTITLIGSSAGKGSETGKANAEAVKFYLVNTFGIDGGRIKTEGRNLPVNPSEIPNTTQDQNLTSVEDNRVDIVSTSPDLMMEVKDNSALCMKPIEITAIDGNSANDAPIIVTVIGAENVLDTD